MNSTRSTPTPCSIKLHQAEKLLVSLISTKLAPEYFWLVMLVDTLLCLPRTIPSSGLRGSEHTREVMYCFNNLASKKTPIYAEAAGAAFKDMEKEIILALTNYLSRLIKYQGTIEAWN